MSCRRSHLGARGDLGRRGETALRGQGERYKVELVDTAEGDISLYTQGEFTDLCRGPHLQDSKPIKAIKLTSLPGAYWRGDEKNTQLTRIYGTAFCSQADLDVNTDGWSRRRRATTAGSATVDLFHFDEHSGVALLARRDGRLQRARGAAAQRERPPHYSEVKTR